MGSPATIRRIVLPREFALLSPGAGYALRSRRLALGLTQTAIADEADISRESLILIESGKSQPRGNTLRRLLAALDMDWPDIAELGARPRSDEPWKEDKLVELGLRLRDARIAAGLNQTDIAGLSGLSAGQVSRIERGLMTRSRLYEDHPDDAHLAAPDRRIRFARLALRKLIGDDGKSGEPIRGRGKEN